LEPLVGDEPVTPEQGRLAKGATVQHGWLLQYAVRGINDQEFLSEKNEAIYI